MAKIADDLQHAHYSSRYLTTIRPRHMDLDLHHLIEFQQEWRERGNMVIE
jgi:hypothetical protein